MSAPISGSEAGFELTPIRVGEREISSDEILREAQYHPAASFEAACVEARRSLVIRALLLDEARRQGLLEAASDERSEQAAISELMDRELPVAPVTSDECEAFYAERPERFKGKPLFSASHILILAAPDDEEARAQARERAVALLDQVRAEPHRFEALAKKHSACPSGASGGGLGQIEPGETPSAFEASLRALEPGEIAGAPVETEHGFHLVRLDASAPGQPLPFESVRDKIQIYLRDRHWRRALHDYIGRLARATTIRGFDLL